MNTQRGLLLVAVVSVVILLNVYREAFQFGNASLLAEYLSSTDLVAAMNMPETTSGLGSHNRDDSHHSRNDEEAAYLTKVDSIRPYEPNPRPAKLDVVDGWNITSDPSWLLNFAIIAFPKCGTSTLMHYFDQNPEVQTFVDERCELGGNQQARLIEDLYDKIPAGDYVRGIKCPRDLENTLALNNYVKFFPNTNLLIGVRHPVKMMESFYNHRIHNGFKMPHTSKLGYCYRGAFNVCLERAQFHWALGALGKVDLSNETSEAVQLMNRRPREVYPLKGRVFLYDVDQLSDSNETRSLEFRKSLQHFLHLRNPLPPLVWFKPGRQGKHLNTTKQDQIAAKKINICDTEHDWFRGKVRAHAVNASRWLRQYFMKSPDVVTSSPDYFESILASWEIDPCIVGNGTIPKATTATTNCTKFGCFMTGG